jgi:signal transduction histidine kinase
MIGRFSLTQRLLVYLLGSAVVTLAVGATVTAYVAWRQTSARLEASAGQAQRSLSAALAESLWMVDRRATEGQLAAGLAFEGVSRIELVSFTGQRFVKAVDGGHGEHAVYRSQIVHEGRELGTLEIAVGRDALMQGILAQIAMLFGIVTLISSVFAASAYFLVQREVARPLQRFVGRIEDYEPGVPLPPAEAWVARAGPEVRQLSAAFERMQEAIESRIRRERELCDQAQTSDRAKSEFLANMSHELRTPMHAIMSFAGLGLEKAASPAAQTPKLLGYFDRINRSADRLMNLLNDLLDLSKLEAGRMTYDFRVQSFAAVVEDAVAEFTAFARVRAQQIEVVGAHELAPLRFDRERIGQVLRNLLSNAIKFNQPGGTVTVRMDVLESGGNAVLEVAVADDGIGIPEGELETVFDKFVQSSKTATGAGGTGLGLAICREIMQAHGGRIAAANGAAGGAVITFVLPVEVTQARAEPVAA